MITFTTWTHPTTGQVRVYVNNLPGSRGAKFWVEEQLVDAFGSDFTIRVRADNLTRGEVGNLQNDAEHALYEAAGRCINTFAEVLALAENKGSARTLQISQATADAMKAAFSETEGEFEFPECIHEQIIQVMRDAAREDAAYRAAEGIEIPADPHGLWGRWHRAANKVLSLDELDSMIGDDSHAALMRVMKSIEN